MRIVGFFIFALLFLWVLGVGCAWVISLVVPASLLGAGATQKAIIFGTIAVCMVLLSFGLTAFFLWVAVQIVADWGFIVATAYVWILIFIGNFIRQHGLPALTDYLSPRIDQYVNEYIDQRAGTRAL